METPTAEVGRMAASGSGMIVYQPLPVSIYAGPGVLDSLGGLLDALGARRALVVTTPGMLERAGLHRRVVDALGPRYADTFHEVRSHSPWEVIVQAAAQAHRLHADCLVSLGGGSAVDTVKGVQLSLAGVEDPRAHAAGQGGVSPPVPWKDRVVHVAIPSTLSGAEHIPAGGITAGDRKVVIRDRGLLPDRVVLAPEAVLSASDDLYASSGLNALSHCIEGVYSPQHHPVSDAHFLHAIRILVRCLPGGLTGGGEPTETVRAARAEAQWAAYLAAAGVTSGVRMGMAHALAHVIGGRYRIPHALAHAIALPHAADFNAEALPDQMALLADAFGGPAPASIGRLADRLGLPRRLRDMGIPREALPLLATDSLQDHNLKNNPRQVSGPEEVLTVLERAW